MSDDSSVERLQKKLYAREGGPPLKSRRSLHEHEAQDVSANWLSQSDVQPTDKDPAHDPEHEHEHEHEQEEPHATGHTPEAAIEQAPALLSDKRVTAAAAAARGKRRVVGRVVKTILLASFIFFLLAAGVATYFFILGNNQVTCEKLDINVSGPISIPSGKELVLNIEIANNNSIPLRDTYLVIDYPEGTRSAADPTATIPVVREQINTIESDERVTMTARAMLYGREQSEQTINFTVEYAIDDSDAVFTCNTQSTLLIATAPVSLSVEGLEEISSGQELTLKVQIHSNSAQLVPDQRLVIDYPFGYQFERAKPAPTEGNNVWDLGDITPGMEHTIELHGVMTAQTTEARAMRFNLGERHPVEPTELATTLQVVEHGLLVTRPFLSLDVTLDGSADTVISAPLGDSMTCNIQYKNTLPNPLYDVEIEAVLQSELLDRKSVRASGGYFRSLDQTILWTPQTDNTLKELPPGTEGRFSFRFSSSDLVDETGRIDPSLNISFNVRARRISEETAVQQVLIDQAQRTIQFITNLIFEHDVLYTVGPFTNTGPHPPRVDRETTYTIYWNLGNSTSNLKDVTVTAALPVYVRWLERVDPMDDAITYNPVTRELQWDVGSLDVGVGTRSPKRVLAFQVAMIPSITQLGSRAPLVTNVTARGVDTFTGAMVERTVQEQTTNLVNDPFYLGVQGKVLE